MIEEERVLELFREKGALLEGHFILTSGRHSDRYVQCARVLQHPAVAQTFGEALASCFKGQEVEAVVGPAMGGIIVAHEVARGLGVRALFTERQEGVMTLRRGFTLEPGERVVVVEDVVTSGGSMVEVVDLVREAGAQLVGLGALVDRSGSKADLPIPLQALARLDIATFDPSDCPLCRLGLEAVKPGSRKTKG